MTSKDKHDRWMLHFWGFGLAAVVASFFVQGEMAFANPVHLATIGLGAALAIIAAHSVALAEDGHGKIATAIATILAVGVGALVIYEGSVADKAIQANISRCAIIQQDMLSAAPRRQDGADLFQALGCKPQGDGMVQLPGSSADRRGEDQHTGRRRELKIRADRLQLSPR